MGVYPAIEPFVALPDDEIFRLMMGEDYYLVQSSYRVHNPSSIADVDGGMFGAIQPPSLYVPNDPDRGLVDGLIGTNVRGDVDPIYSRCCCSGQAL